MEVLKNVSNTIRAFAEKARAVQKIVTWVVDSLSKFPEL